MFKNIKRLKCLPGFLGDIVYKTRTKMVVTVLDETVVVNDYIPAIQDEIREYRQSKAMGNNMGSHFNPSANPIILKSEDLGDLSNAEVTDALDHKLVSILEMSGDQPILIVCDSKNSFAYISERLGVGRREQISLAEDVVATTKSIGDAHKVIDEIKGGKATFISIPHPDADKKMYEHFDLVCDLIYKAKKFQCGRLTLDQHHSIPPEIALRNLRLPYETCFFEFEIEVLTHENPLLPQRMKAYMVATTQDVNGVDTYSAYHFIRKNNGKLSLEDSFMHWHYDERGIPVFGVQNITGVSYSEENTQRNAQVNMSRLCYLLPTINALTTKIVAHEPKAKRLQYGSGKRAPHFTYYSYTEANVEKGTIVDLGYDYDRFTQGVDRKSPLAHERIGHWRQMESSFFTQARGKTIWIAPTLVGQAQDGARGRGLKLKK